MGPFLKRKRSMESWEDLSLSEEVRNFKRVRILSNVKKARRAAFASWEDRSSWAVPKSKRIDTVARVDRFGAESTSTVEVDASSWSLLTESIILSGATFFPDYEEEEFEERVCPCTLDPEEDDTKDGSVAIVQDAHGSMENAAAPQGEFLRFPEYNFSKQAWVHDFDEKPLAQTPHTKDFVDERPFLRFPEYDYSKQAWVDEFDEKPLAQPTHTKDFEMSDSEGRHLTRTEKIRDHYADRLNAIRAQLLRFLPGGPILAPISEPLCQVLDIGRSNAWSDMGKFMASI